MTLSSHPHLRPVEVQQVQHKGKAYYFLQDGTGVASRQLLVPLHFGPLLALCDGTRTLDQLVVDAADRYQVTFEPSEASELLDALDESGMLEGESYRTLRAAAVEAWRAQPSRPLSHAGAGYPASSKGLWRYLQDLLEAAEDPAPPHGDPAPPDGELDWQRGVAVLSPHIDYPRGGKIYAQTWKGMADAVRDADVAVILATDHHGSDRFTLTRQNYATPYGLLPTDEALLNAFVETIGEEAAFEGELRHANEHSIELVANWLHHMRQGEALPILPVLVGSMHSFISNGHRPADDGLTNDVVALLRNEMTRRRVVVVASGDLAHVGPAFGGEPLHEPELATLAVADNHLISAMQSGDAESFFSQIRQVRDRNNVCGVAPIYLTMRAMAHGHAVNTGYAVCPADEAGTSVVSIAGMRFGI